MGTTAFLLPLQFRFAGCVHVAKCAICAVYCAKRHRTAVVCIDRQTDKTAGTIVFEIARESIVSGTDYAGHAVLVAAVAVAPYTVGLNVLGFHPERRTAFRIFV